MTDEKKNLEPASGRTPSRRERMRPVELLGIAVVLGLFTGLIVLMATREPVLALIFFGVAFIATLVITALFVLGMKPTDQERDDLAAQNGQYPPRPVLYDPEDEDDAPGARGGPRNPHD